MHDRDQLTKLLGSLQAEYTPEHPELKEGIGHDIEHVKGAIHRADEIVTLMERDPGTYPSIDREIMVTVSAMHDIGNTVNRDDHALIGAGVAQGYVDMETVLSVPVYVDEIDGYVSDPQKDNMIQAFDSGDLSELTEEEYVSFEQSLTSIMRFDLGYDGVDGKDPNAVSKEDIQQYFRDKYSNIDSYAIDEAVEKLYKNDKLNDVSYNPDLKGFTEALYDIYTPDEIKLIADAIQDHNIDFSDVDTRYEARSIYGMVAADADKDNVFETFVIRTFAYAFNKWPDKSEWFRDENGKPDIEKCIFHVFDQLWERFKAPLEYGSIEAREQRLPEHVLEYKTSLSAIKGVVSGEAAVEKFCELHTDARDCVKHEKGEPYVIMQAYGDDVYSQIDNKYSPESHSDPLNGPVLSLRADCIEKMQDTAVVAEHPEYRDFLPDDCRIENIVEAFFECDSIETAVDRFETEFYGDENNDWNHVVINFIDNEGIAARVEIEYTIGGDTFAEPTDEELDPADAEADAEAFIADMEGQFDEALEAMAAEDEPADKVEAQPEGDQPKDVERPEDDKPDDIEKPDDDDSDKVDDNDRVDDDDNDPVD